MCNLITDLNAERMKRHGAPPTAEPERAPHISAGAQSILQTVGAMFDPGAFKNAARDADLVARKAWAAVARQAAQDLRTLADGLICNPHFVAATGAPDAKDWANAYRMQAAQLEEMARTLFADTTEQGGN